jgi:hypothetical protein
MSNESGTTTDHEFTNVRAHHLAPRREGSLGGEPTYVQACECGATYRNGLLYPPPGVRAAPYDREQAIEADLAQVGIDSIRASLATSHAQRLGTHPA